MEQLSALPPGDEELVKLTLEDRNQFGALILRYQDKLRRYIARLGVRNADDQDDVLQEIFIKTYRNLNGFDTSLSFSSWVYRIAHNEAISWFRKHNVRPEGHLVSDSEEILWYLKDSSNISAELKFDQNINATEVKNAIEKLEVKYKEVLILRFFEHKEYEEISDILMIPVGSVGTLIHRGKKQLKTVLNTEALRI